MFKKIICLGLVIMLGFGTVGCGDDVIDNIKDYSEGAEDPIESTLD